MKDLELLHNKGVWVINPENSLNTEKTFIVIGAARGGTSMVAGSLDRLGVFMGDKLGSTYEYVALSEAIEKKQDDLINKIIASSNQQYQKWGWKRPSSIVHLDSWQGKFRNPHYIIVFRDLFAIANRNRISMLTNLVNNMKSVHDHYGKILEFISKTNDPCMLVSYEKAMMDPKNFINQLAKFIGNSDVIKEKNALEFIQSDSESYLQESRITHTRGKLDKLDSSSVKGWIFYERDKNRPVQIQITVNDTMTFEATADIYRNDLKLKNLHPTGKCGFNFMFPNEYQLTEGDVVSIRGIGDTKEITNSPAKLAIIKS